MITESKLDQLMDFGSTLCLDALRVLGCYRVYIAGARSLTSTPMAGVAVTLRMLPERSDLNAQISTLRENSAEYLAMEKCDDTSVLVIDGMGWQHESVGGEIKFLRLKQRGARGIVADAGIRDVSTLRDYGLAIFAAGQTAKAGPLAFQPAQEGLPIQCGGALVCPGDFIVGDEAGVIVIPQQMIDDVLRICGERQELEIYILEKLQQTPQSPGHFYPINDDVKREFESWKQQRKR